MPLLLLATNTTVPAPLTQWSISNVRVSCDGPEFYVAWDSIAPRGIVYQVYVNRRLAWHGKATSCNVPAPADALGRNVWIEVGAVRPRDATRDLSALLNGPKGAGDRARLSWLGGSYLDPTNRDDLQGFAVYGSASPGGPVDLGNPLAKIAAYPGGTQSDGFGIGGFGQGGFGRAASLYEWRSGPLASGTWTFVVVPFDRAGNALPGGQASASIAIAASPRPPAADASGRRLTYSYSGPTTRLATLSWLASP